MQAILNSVSYESLQAVKPWARDLSLRTTTLKCVRGEGILGILGIGLGSVGRGGEVLQEG